VCQASMPNLQPVNDYSFTSWGELVVAWCANNWVDGVKFVASISVLMEPWQMLLEDATHWLSKMVESQSASEIIISGLVTSINPCLRLFIPVLVIYRVLHGLCRLDWMMRALSMHDAHARVANTNVITWLAFRCMPCSTSAGLTKSVHGRSESRKK